MRESAVTQEENLREEKRLTVSSIVLAFSCCFYIGLPLGHEITVRMLDIAAALSIALSWKAWIRLKRRRGFDRTEWCMIGFFGYCFLSVFLACLENGGLYLAAWLRAIRLGYLFVAFQLAQLWGQPQKQIFLKCLLWFGSAQAVFAAVMYFFQVEEFCAGQTAWKDGQLLHRASGFVADAASFAFLCSSLMLISMVVIWTNRGQLRSSGVICFLTNALGLLASDTRTAIVAVTLILSMAGAAALIRQKTILPLDPFWMLQRIIAAVVVACAAISLIVNLFFADEFCALMDCWMYEIRRTSGTWSFVNALLSERPYIWAQYLKILASQPIVKLFSGSGYFLFEELHEVGSLKGTEFIAGNPTHNMFLNVFMGTGFIGWCFFGGMFGGLAGCLKNKSQKMLTICAQLLFLCQLIFMLCDDSLSMVNSSVLMFAFLSFAQFPARDR